MTNEFETNAKEIVEEIVAPDPNNWKTILTKVGIVSLITGTVAGTITLLVRKNRDKINEIRIKKLRKQGYIIIEPTKSNADGESLEEMMNLDDEEK